VAIWNWPWRTKTGRTVESYDKRGHLRIRCIAGGSPVTGHISVDAGRRRTRCLECGRDVGVTGPRYRPRIFVHNGDCTL
jgi:hypothetical protein